MNTIADKLEYLGDTKTDIGEAIEAKGGSVTGKTFRQYATEISNLPSGGGGTKIAVSPDVSEYTGGSEFILTKVITGVNFPSGITSLGNGAFENCSSLTIITIPSGVTSIGSSAFNNCSNLTSFTCEATTPPTLDSYSLDSTNNCPIYVPAESVEAYQTANNWSEYASRIQAIPNSN